MPLAFRKILRSAATIAVGLLLFAGVLEAGIRILHLVPDALAVRYRAVPGDEDFAPVPSQSSRSLYGIEHRVNALGLRGAEVSPVKPAGVTRIALLGDSVVWGYGVAEADALPAALEAQLSARGKKFEVLNLGLQATNTANERARFARLAPLLRPDVAVIVVLYNDLQDGPEHFRITSVGSLSLPDRRAPFPDSWRPWLERLALYHALIRVVGRLEGRMDEFRPSNLPLLEQHLGGFLDTARQCGAKPVIAVTPGLWPEVSTYTAFAGELAAFSRARGVTFVNLEEALGRPPDRKLFLRYDPVHPNAEGNRRIAAALARTIP